MNRRLLVIAAGALLAVGYLVGRAGATSATSTAPEAKARVSAAALAPSAPAHRGGSALAVDPTLAEDLRDADVKVRRAALRETVRSPGVDAELLLAASRDPDLEVAAVATLALGEAYARGEVPVSAIVARAQDRSLDEKVRFAALTALGQVPSPEALTLLGDLAARGSASERATAALLLRHQDPGRATPTLIGMLSDADAHVRDSARDSLRSHARGRDFGDDGAAWTAWWASRR